MNTYNIIGWIGTFYKEFINEQNTKCVVGVIGNSLVVQYWCTKRDIRMIIGNEINIPRIRYNCLRVCLRNGNECN